MARIIESTEEHGLERIAPLTAPAAHRSGGAITLAAVEVAEFVDARYLCIFTESGEFGARDVAAALEDPDARVHPEPGHPSPPGAHLGRAVVPRRACHAHRRHVPPGRRVPAANDLAKVGDKVVVIAAGSPPGIVGSRRTTSACTRSATRSTTAAPFSQAERKRLDRSPGVRCRGASPVCCAGTSPGWWNGRHGALKMLCRKACGFKSRSRHVNDGSARGQMRYAR